MDEAHSATAQVLTAFAAPERFGRQAILEQYQAIVGSHCRAFFDSLPTIVLVLNRQRQVVFANAAAVAFFKRGHIEDLLGLRPGEALGCVNADAAPGGCGTSRHCRHCGAVQAILEAIDGHAADRDCTLLRRDDDCVDALDMHVWTNALDVNGQAFILCSLTDVSHEMRRRSMERIFFHDVLNLAGGISGLLEVLLEEQRCRACHELGILDQATRSLVDEIVSQRELLAAEAKELQAEYAPANTLALLSMLRDLYGNSPQAEGQTLAIDAQAADVEVETDARLVRRVLGNMIKNALEAGRPGDTVRLGCVDAGGSVRFSVHNAAVIPAFVREDIFHRRCSTKGAGRGLGTYSMLLLSERYLGATLDFVSDEGQGTTFTLLLPKRQERM